jgi:tetratricopeptide (TPR) repeat protein
LDISPHAQQIQEGIEGLVIQRNSRKYRLLAIVLACLLTPITAAAASLGQSPPTDPETYSGLSIEPNQQVFATMCALDAAGFDADASTLEEMPNRLALRADLLKLNGPATEALRKFYREHVFADPVETLSRYLAFALVAGPPPQFRLQVDRDLLPPDVLSIDGFQPILSAFYQEANLESRWRQVAGEYEQAAIRYRSPVLRVASISNAYVREVTKPSNGRSFVVYVEPLVGTRTVSRNLDQRYAIVVGSTPNIPVDEIRHAYLHFLLDPLPLQNRAMIQRKGALLNIAAKAPQLPSEYREDFIALTDECFIKAVELRIERLSADQLEAAIKDADRSGFILVRPMVGQLQKFEKAEPAMSYYFPDLIEGIDMQAEQKRLQHVTFYPADMTPAKPQTADADAQEADLDKMLDEGDREIALQDAPAAAAIFKKVLEKAPQQPRAIYGLAIASVLGGKAAQAKDLFEQIVSASLTRSANGQTEAGAAIDPALVAWSHIYLGRIHDIEGDRDLAIGEYRAALGVEGAPESARVAAQRGVSVAYLPQAGPGGNPPQRP